MFEKLTEFIERHNFFILTTHDAADADGLGAQLAFAFILSEKRKQVKIINASPVPQHFRFMDPKGIVEYLDGDQHKILPEHAGFILLDTGELQNTGKMKDIIARAKEVFVIDHHEPNPKSNFSGICDPLAASTCELAVEFSEFCNINFDHDTAFALYTGIVYDTGFFAYQKTSSRTFHSIQILLNQGINPHEAYYQLCETKSTETLLLQKKSLASLTLHFENRVAMQVLRLSDFAETGALQEDTDGFVNFPLKSKKIILSLLFKEMEDGRIRCSLRSKGNFNVAKMAQELGGGGHINASGFKSNLELDRIITITMNLISRQLDQQ